MVDSGVGGDKDDGGDSDVDDNGDCNVDGVRNVHGSNEGTVGGDDADGDVEMMMMAMKG